MADVYDKAKRSRIMAAVRGKNTAPERALYSLLKTLGYKVRRHAKNLPGSPDLVLFKEKVVIFLNGCFWHGHGNCRRATLPTTNRKFWENKISGNKRRDQRQKRLLNKMGWRVVTFWTCKTISCELVSSRLKRALAYGSKLKAKA